MKSLILIFGVWTMGHATGLDEVITDSYTSPTLSNLGGTTDIVNLSGTDTTNHLVENFIIKSLPDVDSGRLVMGDGITPVALYQHLTIEEVYGLCFHPLSTFVGDAVFTYVAVDNVGVEGTLGTITIPVIGGTVSDVPRTDDKENSEILNSSGALEILDLSGTDAEGDGVNRFIIKNLPASQSGILYMADGSTPVVKNQILTDEEADGLKFHPREGFVGEALFTYRAIDDNELEGNEAIVTIPIIGTEVVTAPITDHKKNAEISNLSAAVTLLPLTGRDRNGDAVNSFIIKTLPNVNGGVLYLADGTTAVVIGETLTSEEARALIFNPKENFVGDITFDYVAVDDNGIEGNIGIVTLPIVSIAHDLVVVTDTKRNGRPMVHTRGATDIINLSGRDKDGVAVTSFIVTALPFTRQGVLYLADGTPVRVGQTLTLEEANGLKFDPTAGFVGDATFQYVAVDKAGNRGNVAVVSIPVIAEKACNCKAFKEDVPVFSNLGMILMLIFSVGLGLLLIKREATEL